MGYCLVCDSGLPDQATACPQCGAAVVDAPEPARSDAAPAAPSLGLAVAALILNIIIWPGLGSLVAGRAVGWFQGFAFLFGLLTLQWLVGIPIALGAWVTGIVTGVDLINRADRTVPAAPPA